MVESKKIESKATIPINWIQKIEDYIRFKKPEYSEKIIKQFTIDGKKTPILRIELVDFPEDFLLRFRREPENFLLDFQDALIQIAEFDQDFKNKLAKRKEEKDFRGFHYIPDCKNIDWVIPVRDNFTKNLIDDEEKIYRFKSRFLSLGLERAVEFFKIAWECMVCGSSFTTAPYYRKTREKYQTPKYCNNKRCKAKGKHDFRLVSEKSIKYEKRTFTIVDLENKDVATEIKCYISQNIDYFTEKTKNLHCNDEIEVLGILRTDTADIFTSKEDPQVLYYIEVIDIKTGSSNDVNPKIVKQIKKEIKKHNTYCNQIIDSIHPYSQNIINFFPIKLSYLASFITSDSYTNIRNGINSIIAGHAGTLKSKIANEFKKKLGANNFGIIFGKNTTAKGLVPVAQRNNNEKNLVKRYGAIPYYNKKTFVVDEAQYLYMKDPDALECFKCYEEGVISRALDGTTINAPAEGTVILSLNYRTEDEAYDFTKTLVENLGFPEDQKSVLDRFDLHCRIPRNIDKIVEILFNRGDDSYKPRFLVSDEIIFNYIMEAKRIYTNGVKIPEELSQIVKKIYNAIIQEKKSSKKKYVLNPREAEIIKKVLRVIAAMRLRSKVNEDDFEYLKKYFINAIIPFQDNRYIIKNRKINDNEIFINVFELLTEIHKDYFYISEFITFLRDYIESNYFEEDHIGNGMPILGHFIDKENNLSNNKFKKLLDNNKDFIQERGYIIDKIKNKTSFINQEWMNTSIKESIKEMFKTNNNNVLNLDNVIEVLEINLDFSLELLIKTLNLLIKEKFIEELKVNQIKFINNLIKA